MSSREQFEAWGMSDPDLSEMLKSEVYASIAWMAWQAASKASEQQLAAVVAALSVHTELSVAAERAWERTMMYACGEDGPKSVADKFCELKAKCAALAAENATFKDINAWCKTDAFSNMYREFKTAEAVGCCNIDCMHDAMLVAIMHAPETPVTDAFLAEVRASAVDEVCLKINNCIANCYQDEQVGLDEAATICGDFASELRKGVQS